MNGPIGQGEPAAQHVGEQGRLIVPDFRVQGMPLGEHQGLDDVVAFIGVELEHVVKRVPRPDEEEEQRRHGHVGEWVEQLAGPLRFRGVLPFRRGVRRARRHGTPLARTYLVQ